MHRGHRSRPGAGIAGIVAGVIPSRFLLPGMVLNFLRNLIFTSRSATSNVIRNHVRKRPQSAYHDVLIGCLVRDLVNDLPQLCEMLRGLQITAECAQTQMGQTCFAPAAYAILPLRLTWSNHGNARFRTNV